MPTGLVGATNGTVWNTFSANAILFGMLTVSGWVLEIMIVSDAAITPGNSGGPLINSKGEVIGIVTATLDSIVTLYKKGVLPQNVNFAVKSDYAFPIISNITSEGKSGSKKDFSEWVKKYRDSVKMVIAR